MKRIKTQIKSYKGRDGKSVENKRRVIAHDIELVIEKRGKNWSTRITIDGKLTRLNLRTTCEGTAANTALDKARAAEREQWDFVHKGRSQRGLITIGEIISIYSESPEVVASSDTRKGNVTAFCNLIRTALRLKKSADVSELSSSILTGDLLRKYQAAAIKDVPEGTERDTAKRTANATRRCARSLFTERILAFDEPVIYANLPDLTGLLKVPSFAKVADPDFSYEDISPWVDKVKANLPALKESDPTAYLLFQLCIGCGLRRSEALNARKDWIVESKDGHKIHVQAYNDFRPKGRKNRKVPVPPEVLADIRLLSDDSEHIIPAPAGRYTRTDRKRLQGVARRLNRWFVELGWPFKKKIHTLRSWFGAHVSVQCGIFAAQRLLGHADVSTTNKHYADLVDTPEYTLDLGAPAKKRKAA